MRWFWIDRFNEFVRGKQVTAVKNVSLAEEHLHDHFPGAALMPNSLVVEGMAQTAGLLIADALEFNRRVVLAKVAKAEFQYDAVPGDSILFHAVIDDLKPTGSLASVKSVIVDEKGEERPQGKAELFFAHLEPGEGVPKLFEPEELLKWLDHMHIYDIGRDEAGNPLSRPDW